MIILVKLSLLIESNQSTNTKLKCKHSCKQYQQLKSNKWGFKWWCICSSSSHLYETHLHPGKKQEREYNLDESVVLIFWEILIAYYILANIFNSSNLIPNYFIMTYIELVQLNCKMIPKPPDDKSKKLGANHYQYSKKWFASSGKIIIT